MRKYFVLLILLSCLSLSAQTYFGLNAKLFGSVSIYPDDAVGNTAKAVESSIVGYGAEMFAFSPIKGDFYFKLSGSWQVLGAEIQRKEVEAIEPIKIIGYKERHYHHFISSSLDFGWKYLEEGDDLGILYVGFGGMADIGGRRKQTFYYQDESTEKVKEALPKLGFNEIIPYLTLSFQRIMPLKEDVNGIFEVYYTAMLTDYESIIISSRKYTEFGLKLGIAWNL